MLAFTASSPTKAAKGRPLWQKYFFDGMLFSPDRFHLLAIVKALWPKYTAKTINPNPPFQGKFGFYCAGDPCGNRTHVNGVRGRCLNRLTNGPYKKRSRHLPIFTGRFQPTIVGTSELNYCVRNGNRWDLTVIDTGRIYCHIFGRIFSFLRYIPSKLNKNCAWQTEYQSRLGQALDLLVHAS